MESTGDPGAGLLGALSPSNSSAPGDLEREKLLKLDGQPGGAGRDRTVGSIQGAEEGKGSGPGPARGPGSGPVPASRPAQDPLYDVPEACGGQAGGPQRPGRAVSLRERLLLTRPVWLQLRANAAAALHVLRTEPPGVSLVRSFQGVGGRRAGHGGPEPPHPFSDVPGAEI